MEVKGWAASITRCIVVLSDEWADLGADTDREGWGKRIQQSVMSQSDRGIDSKFRAYLKDMGISAAIRQRSNTRAQDVRKRKLLEKATGESTEYGDKVMVRPVRGFEHRTPIDS